MAELRDFAPLHPRYNPASYQLTKSLIGSDLPLRAKSVSLTERPSSKYQRQIHSAGYPQKPFFQTNASPRPASTAKRQKTSLVKQQKRKSIEKVPCAISIQTISIPMKYANYSHSTSKTHQNLFNVDRIDSKTKSSNPPKQVGDNKRLCTTVGCGNETENRLLVKIREANQVRDFERILNNCNAIERSRVPRHEWRVAGLVSPRPSSAYSLQAVSQAYHCLFQQHHDSLQPLIDAYRQTEHRRLQQPPPSLLQDNWYENLQNLSEFYEDDPVLKRELEAVNDKILSEKLKSTEPVLSSSRNKNFNVNLTDLIGLHVSGEGFSPGSNHEALSPDVDKSDEVYYEKEWLAPIMSSDDGQNSEHKSDSVDCLAQNLNSVNINSDDKVPTITLSNCCDGCNRSELAINSEIDIYLAVPSTNNIDETRPPMT